MLDRRARETYYSGFPRNITYTHGQFDFANGTDGLPIRGVLGLSMGSYQEQNIVEGCFRDPIWPWWRKPFPWWMLFLLVPLYSLCSSLSNLQALRSIQLPIMILFSTCAFAANRGTSYLLPGRTDIVSAAGGFVIGTLGNLYSRVARGTAFTSMVTGVLFLVPVSVYPNQLHDRESRADALPL